MHCEGVYATPALWPSPLTYSFVCALQVASAVVSITHPYHHDLRPEASSGKPVAVVDERVLQSHTWGSFTTNEYLDMLDLCGQGAAKVAELTRAMLKR